MCCSLEMYWNKLCPSAYYQFPILLACVTCMFADVQSALVGASAGAAGAGLFLVVVVLVVLILAVVAIGHKWKKRKG